MEEAKVFKVAGSGGWGEREETIPEAPESTCPALAYV